MPKVFQCANCKKYLIGGTYTLVKHFQKCVLDTPVKQTKNSINNYHGIHKSDVQKEKKGRNIHREK